MKRFLVLAAALAVLVSVSVNVTHAAEAVAPHWMQKALKFRTHATTGTDGTDAYGGYTDSVKASGIAKFDTTAAISTAGWWIPSYGSTATDSATVCKLMIYDAGDLATVTLGKTSATAESIYVKTQVSANNGLGWHDCAIIPGQAPVLNAFTVQVTVNAAVLTFVSSTNTGSSDKLWSVNFTTGNGSAALKSGQDINHMWLFPWVRFIICGTRATTNHNLAATIRYVSVLNQDIN